MGPLTLGPGEAPAHSGCMRVHPQTPQPAIESPGAARDGPSRPWRRRGAVVGALLTAGLIAAACSSNTSTSGTTSTVRAGPGPTATAGPGPTATVGPGTSTTLATSAALSAALTQAIGQERDALATYQGIVAVQGSVPPFDNVLASEQQHVATLEQAAVAHGVPLPGNAATAVPAPSTRTASCQVGVNVEQGIIATYGSLLPTVTAYPDVTRIFTSLRDTSQTSHLPAFQHCA